MPEPTSPSAPSTQAAGAQPLDALRGARRPAADTPLRLAALACAADSAPARRLALLGIRPGVELRVLHAPGPRGAVLGVGTARIALGPELVRQLHVHLPDAEGAQAAPASAPAS